MFTNFSNPTCLSWKSKMTTGQTPSVDRDCVIYEAQEWLLNGLCGEIIFSTVVSKVKNNFWEFINLGQKHLVCFYIIYQYHHNVIKFQGGTVLKTVPLWWIQRHSNIQYMIDDKWEKHFTLRCWEINTLHLEDCCS